MRCAAFCTIMRSTQKVLWLLPEEALAKTPRELWIVRILARLFLAGVLQMRGDSNQAYAAIYRGFEEEETQSNAFKATLVMTVCWLHWLEANLQGMAQAASQCITLSQQSDIPQILNYGHYHLGRVCYQQNDLAAAEEHFSRRRAAALSELWQLLCLWRLRPGPGPPGPGPARRSPGGA